MRDLKLIKRWLIVFALVLAQVPSSVLASLCNPVRSCSMPCCAPKVVQELKPKACEACPDEAMQSVESGDSMVFAPEHSAVGSAEKDSCPCKIAPTPPQSEKTTVAIFSSSSQSPPPTDAYLGTSLQSPAFEIVDVFVPGIVGVDSGPPTGGSYCAWCGRAPPMILA